MKAAFVKLSIGLRHLQRRMEDSVKSVQMYSNPQKYLATRLEREVKKAPDISQKAPEIG